MFINKSTQVKLQSLLASTVKWGMRLVLIVTIAGLSYAGTMAANVTAASAPETSSRPAPRPANLGSQVVQSPYAPVLSPRPAPRPSSIERAIAEALKTE